MSLPYPMPVILEAALSIANEPLSLADLQKLFDEPLPSAAELRQALHALSEHYQTRGIELKEVASGFRLQAKTELSPWLTRLFAERVPKYSRTFLETLAIIAYKQPITRAEIEDIRGVPVNSNVIKILIEREWVRILGHKDLPGKPAILGTTKQFLDYFNLKSLTELPSLLEFKDIQDQLPLQKTLDLSETFEDIEQIQTQTQIDDESEIIASTATHNDGEEKKEENNIIPIESAHPAETSPSEETDNPVVENIV